LELLSKLSVIIIIVEVERRSTSEQRKDDIGKGENSNDLQRAVSNLLKQVTLIDDSSSKGLQGFADGSRNFTSQWSSPSSDRRVEREASILDGYRPRIHDESLSMVLRRGVSVQHEHAITQLFEIHPGVQQSGPASIDSGSQPQHHAQQLSSIQTHGILAPCRIRAPAETLHCSTASVVPGRHIPPTVFRLPDIPINIPDFDYQQDFPFPYQATPLDSSPERFLDSYFLTHELNVHVGDKIDVNEIAKSGPVSPPRLSSG
jgi:hypothetical protein